MTDRIYQFKITIKDIAPLIWRRILVPETYNFWDLHVAIQDAMGWLDYHLHVFRIRPKHSHSVAEIGIPDLDGFDDEPAVLAGWETPISRYFNDVGVSAEYEYDFGDSWHHDVILEGILMKEKKQKYPACIAGERACPPEDCGGVSGYHDLLKIISDPDHDEHESMITWLGGKYDPDEFSLSKVKFDNPKKRWRRAFTGN
jgi:hypothetical protein